MSRRRLAAFTVASAPGNERTAIAQVQDAVAELRLPRETFDRLGTAVGESVMNAIEHGHHNHADLLVEVEVEVQDDAGRLFVTIRDHGGAPNGSPVEPDLALKLEGEQTPRGWGLFLIRHMVDEMTVETVGSEHTVQLVIDHANGRAHANGREHSSGRQEEKL